MRSKLIIQFALMVLALSACVPYVGHKMDKDKTQCVGAVVFPTSFMGRGGGADHCYGDLPEPEPNAPTSKKHVQFTESQRLAIAQSAAKKIYPIEKHRFEWADRLAHAITGNSFNGYAYFQCDEMAATRDVALRLKEQIPTNQVYRAIAQAWSQRYSDEQLALISKYASSESMESLSSRVAPQPTIESTNNSTEVLKFFLKTADEYRNTYMPIADKALATYRKQQTFAGKTCSQIGDKWIVRDMQ